MGGTVFVGIRRTNMTEHLYECWTNSIPWLFADPDFISDGPGVDEFIRIAEEMIASGEGLYTKRHRFVTYSEYGVILIDHHAKKILSCQGYTNVGRMFASWHDGRAGSYPPEEAAIITRLNKSGKLLKLEDSNTFKEIPPEKKDEILRMLSKSTNGSLENGIYLSLVVHTDLSDFDVIHAPNCSKKERSVVRKFLVDNGWNARAYGQRR